MIDGRGELLRRDSVVLRPDNRRVIAKLFLPGQELLAHGLSRAQLVLNRVVALDDDEVDRQLAGLRADFGPRHPDIDATFDEHFELVAHQLPDPAALSAARRALVGAVLHPGVRGRGGRPLQPLDGGPPRPTWHRAGESAVPDERAGRR